MLKDLGARESKEQTITLTLKWQMEGMVLGNKKRRR